MLRMMQRGYFTDLSYFTDTLSEEVKYSFPHNITLSLTRAASTQAYSHIDSLMRKVVLPHHYSWGLGWTLWVDCRHLFGSFVDISSRASSADGSRTSSPLSTSFPATLNVSSLEPHCKVTQTNVGQGCTQTNVRQGCTQTMCAKGVVHRQCVPGVFIDKCAPGMYTDTCTPGV